jgi:hypothetical protein
LSRYTNPTLLKDDNIASATACLLEPSRKEEKSTTEIPASVTRELSDEMVIFASDTERESSGRSGRSWVVGSGEPKSRLRSPKEAPVVSSYLMSRAFRCYTDSIENVN